MKTTRYSLASFFHPEVSMIVSRIATLTQFYRLLPTFIPNPAISRLWANLSFPTFSSRTFCSSKATFPYIPSTSAPSLSRWDKLDGSAIGKKLEETYSQCRNNDPQAIANFHTLMKRVAGDLYTIESSNDFDSLHNCLFLWISKLDYSKFTNPTQIIEVLLYLSKKSKIGAMFQPTDTANLFSFTIESLKNIPFAQWPKKGEVITQTLEVLSPSFKLSFAQQLRRSSCDEKTQEIGRWMQEILSPYPRLTYLYLSKLRELLPHINASYIEAQFNCPYPEYNPQEHKLHYGNLHIGLHKKELPKTGKTETSLVAFDITDKHVVWSLLLETGALECRLQNNYIAVQSSKDEKWYLLHPHDGSSVV